MDSIYRYIILSSYSGCKLQISSLARLSFHIVITFYLHIGVIRCNDFCVVDKHAQATTSLSWNAALSNIFISLILSSPVMTNLLGVIIPHLAETRRAERERL